MGLNTGYMRGNIVQSFVETHTIVQMNVLRYYEELRLWMGSRPFTIEQNTKSKNLTPFLYIPCAPERFSNQII